MKKSLTILALMTVLAINFMACSDAEESSSRNEDKVETADISKMGAVETMLTTEHLNDSLDVLITTHKVWKNNMLIREKRHIDTVPALGTASQTAADAQGNATTATGKKDYEFYITVK